MAAELVEGWSTFIDVGAFGVVVWLIIHVHKNTLPKMVEDFSECIKETRDSFVTELQSMRALFAEELRAQRREFREELLAE